MSTTDTHRTTRPSRFTVELISTTLMTIVMVIVFLAVGRPMFAVATVSGWGVGIGYLLLARWRTVRNADSSGIVARVSAFVGDERDRRLTTKALASTGYASFLTVTAAVFAAILGASAIAIAFGAFVAQCVVFLIAFVVAVRRG